MNNKNSSIFRHNNYHNNKYEFFYVVVDLYIEVFLNKKWNSYVILVMNQHLQLKFSEWRCMKIDMEWLSNFSWWIGWCENWSTHFCLRFFEGLSRHFPSILKNFSSDFHYLARPQKQTVSKEIIRGISNRQNLSFPELVYRR